MGRRKSHDPGMIKSLLKYTERAPGTGRWVCLYLLQTHTLPLFLDVFLSLCLSVCLFLSVFLSFLQVFLSLSLFLSLSTSTLSSCLPCSTSHYIYLSLSVYASISVSLCASLTVSLCLSFSSQIHINALFPPFLYFLFLLCFVFIYYSFIFILNMCKYGTVPACWRVSRRDGSSGDDSCRHSETTAHDSGWQIESHQQSHVSTHFSATLADAPNLNFYLTMVWPSFPEWLLTFPTQHRF